MAGVPDESKDKYRALFKKNFDATNHQHSEIQSNVKIEFPSMLKDVPRDQRIIEVGSKGEFRGILLDFEVEPSWLRNHVYDFELFRYLISHPNEGSLQWFLRKEDLSEKLSLSAYKVNNRAYIGLAIIPTEHGLKHYKELIKKVFHFISSIRERGIEQEVLNRLSIEAAIRTQNKNRKALSVINDLKQKAGLGLPESSATLAPTRYDQVNTESIRSFVENAFPVDKLLVTAMGPRFRSHEQVHPVFDRHFKVIRSAEPLKSWEVALNTPIGYDPNRIQVLKGELLPLPKKSLGRLNAKIVQREGGEIWLTQKTASKSKRVLAVQTKPIDTALEERVALDLLSVALRNERSNQLSEISLSSNVKVMKSISYGFYLLFNGEQGANIDILNRFLELFFGYKPSEEAFEKAKKFLKNKIKKEGGGFSAFLALNRAMSFIDHEPATPKRRLSILEALTLDRVLQLRGQAFKNATTSILVDSPSGRELLKEVSQTIKTYIPSTLSQKKLEYFQESFPQIETKERIFFEFSKEKSQDALGIARVYQGPDLTQENQRDYLAWSLFRSSLKDAIFGLNRTEKGLGYVQGATLAPAQSKTRVALYGMADNPNQWDEIEKGWDKILGNIEDYVTRESLENARVGMLRSLSLLPSSPEKAVFEKIQHAQKYGNPNFQEEQIKVLSKLTPKEIIERAIKYLKGPSWTVIGSRDRSMVERRLRLDSKDMKTERSFLTREGLFKNSQKPKQRPVQKISGRCRGSFL
jgi:secreted Zn-dependent insulinase-like peptidase